MNERITRRDLLGIPAKRAKDAASAFLIAELFAACSGSKKTDRTPAPLPKDPPEWEALSVISFERDRGPYLVDAVEKRLSAPIGMSELYLASNADPDNPMVAVCMVWDKRKVVRGENGRVLQDVRFGFQPIVQPFFPDPLHLKTDVEEIPPDVVNAFGGRVLLGMARIIGERVNDPWTTFTLMPKPAAGVASTLVFGEGLIETQNGPSPEAFIKARFTFDAP